MSRLESCWACAPAGVNQMAIVAASKHTINRNLKEPRIQKWKNSDRVNMGYSPRKSASTTHDSLSNSPFTFFRCELPGRCSRLSFQSLRSSQYCRRRVGVFGRQSAPVPGASDILIHHQGQRNTTRSKKSMVLRAKPTAARIVEKRTARQSSPSSSGRGSCGYAQAFKLGRQTNNLSADRIGARIFFFEGKLVILY